MRRGQLDRADAPRRGRWRSWRLRGVTDGEWVELSADLLASATVAGDAEEGAQLRATQANHMTGFENQMGVESDIKFRQPSSLQANGNTVETHREHSEFMDNALKYQASLNLLDSRIKGLRAAIKGE